ncbi:MAG: hypothetical protein ACJA0H_001433 [Francisellaceae bacterium]|jgi:hypothetical protein
MEAFPKEKIVTNGGSLSFDKRKASIKIELMPFEYHGSETVETEILLEGIKLPVEDFESLQGNTYIFPVNPEDGYIDGSLYLEHAHHPVDVTKIIFGKLKGSMLEATIEGTVALSFEGLEHPETEEEYDDFSFGLSMILNAV